MHPQKKSLQLGNSIIFDKVFEAGTFITFYSETYKPVPDKNVDVDNTSLNIQSLDDDYLLHISFRRAENQIVFNSFPVTPETLEWGPEDRVSLQGVFSKTDARVSVRLEANHYKVYVDDSIIHTYKKRIIKDAQRISYRTNSESVFTNPITVEVLAPEEGLVKKIGPAASYEKAYFNLNAKDVAEESGEQD
ncbi:galectin [Fusarium napiforme]|uniref:Galectin n=1 Tax=Fusarium napiforme TaxID=42672 RepID=A0A8H5MQQ1_9HYPO|nr:galectin [Fusarium napiforme]